MKKKQIGKKRKKESKLSIKYKLFAYFGGFTLLILIFLWVFQTVFLDDFYKYIKTKEIKKTASSIEKNIENEDLKNILKMTSEIDNMNISIFNKEGQFVDLSEPQIPLEESMLTKLQYELVQLYQLAEKNGGSYLRNISMETLLTSNALSGNIIKVQPDSDGKKVDMGEAITYIKLVKTKSGETLAIKINSQISPLSATIDTLRTQLLIFTFVFLVIAGILTFILSRYIAKPIVDLNRKAKALSHGDFQVNFEENGYKEIAELQETLNYAVGELSKVETLRKELIANVSHDLRTPLTMITGYSEAMRDLPEENTPENIQIIIDEARRLSTLVNDVLDISKLQNEEVDLVIQPFPLTKAIEKTVERYSKMLKEQGYHIDFQYEGEVEVYGDQTKILQVVYNLLNNGITYTDEETKQVLVRQTVEGNKVMVEVVDFGQGIEPELQDKIWERYYRSKENHKRAINGSGLGLSIVKEILNKHHAPFGVTSTMGQGSTFWFQLDLVEGNYDENNF